jgi:hypothetical protein
MIILNLTIKKKWFDMIESGEKPEEYREIKDYYVSRFIDYDAMDFKHYDAVLFRNGYSSDSPTCLRELKFIDIGTGIEDWGAVRGKKYFILKLGRKL